MLFILRQLRRLELRKRSGQYFVYAIGEIVLIVMGILIALQISEWNQGRKDGEQERIILQRIEEELSTELRLVSFRKQSLSEKKEAMSRIERAFDEPRGGGHFEFLLDVRTASYFGSGFPGVQSLTFDEVVYAGKLSLIKNKELRVQIQNYYRVARSLEGQAENTWESEFTDIIFGILPITPDRSRSLVEGLSDDAYASIAETILESELKSEFTRERNRANFLVSMWDQIEKNCGELKAAIRTELNK